MRRIFFVNCCRATDGGRSVLAKKMRLAIEDVRHQWGRIGKWIFEDEVISGGREKL